MNYLTKVLILNLCLVANIVSSAQIACRDESGQELDWWSAIKLPVSSKSSNYLIVNGTAYTFLTEQFQNWTLSSKSLNNPESMSGRTLSVVYSTQKTGDIGYMMYNDQVGGDDGSK